MTINEQNNNEQNIQAAAELLATAWRSRTPIPGLPADCKPQTRQQAYAIQDAMAAILGFEVAGWKIGGFTVGQMTAQGLDGPMIGRVLAPTVAPTPAELEAEPYNLCMLECELAFVINQELAPRETPYHIDELMDNMVLCLAIELTGSRYTEGYNTDWFCNIADNGNSGGLIIGPEIPDWRELRLADISVDLHLDRGEGIPNLQGDWRVDPLAVMQWTANCLSERGISLAAGSIVSTGSLTEPQPFRQGNSAIAIYSGLGELQVCLV